RVQGVQRCVTWRRSSAASRVSGGSRDRAVISESEVFPHQVDAMFRIGYRLGQADPVRVRVGPILDLGAKNRPARRAPPRHPDSPYFTVEDAAAYCRLAVGTIYNRRREIRRMPGTGKLLFRREDLDAWLQAR